MAKAEHPSNAQPAPAGDKPAAYLDMPAERRAAAAAAVATLVATAQRVADELPLQADVDDFRRVLVAEAER